VKDFEGDPNTAKKGVRPDEEPGGRKIKVVFKDNET